MRIAINGLFWGQTTTGSGQYIQRLWRAMLDIAPENEYTLFRGAQPVESGAEPRGRTLATPFDGWSANLAKVWFEQAAFPRACRLMGADVAHVPYWASPLLPPVPTVVTVHDLIPLLLPAYRGSPPVRLYTQLVAASARRARLVLTDSHASQRDIVRRLRIPAGRVRVVYLAADETFRPVDEPTLAAARRRYGLPERYFLYLGGFDRRKNVGVAIRALARLSSDVPLVIAGRLPERDTAFFPDPRRAAAEAGVEDRVVFAGWVEERDKPALYGGAVALVFPSLYEGFGLPVLEALACGAPAIASKRGSLPEIVGGGGLLFEPDDVEGMAEAMAAMLGDASWRGELRAKGLAHAAAFSWERAARETLAAYREVAGCASSCSPKPAS